MAQHRFLFLSPSMRELAFLKHWRWTRAFAWLFPVGFLSLFEAPHSPLIWSFFCVTGLSALLQWRLSDIRRRAAQATFGFVEITPDELRIGLAFKESHTDFWRDYRGYEVKNNALRIRFLQERLVRLSELEAPNDLINVLRAQTVAPNDWQPSRS